LAIYGHPQRRAEFIEYYHDAGKWAQHPETLILVSKEGSKVKIKLYPELPVYRLAD